MAGRNKLKRHGEYQTEKVRIAFTKSEKQLIQDACDKIGQTMTEFCRVAAVEAAGHEMKTTIERFVQERRARERRDCDDPAPSAPLMRVNRPRTRPDGSTF